MVKLKRLEATSVRGLSNFELDLDGESLVLWGENASGKTAIVDAVEFLLTGKIAHIEGVSGLSLTRHGAHVEMGPKFMKAGATFDPGSITVERKPGDESRVPGPLRELWQWAARRGPILRRAQLLDIIAAEPAERYRYVARLMGVESLEDVELAMMRARDQSRQEASVAGERQKRVARQLDEVCGERCAGETEALALLRRDAGGLDLAPPRNIEEVGTRTEEWFRSAKVQDQEAVVALTNLKEAAGNAAVPEGLVGSLTRLAEMHQELAGKREALESLYEAELLEQGGRIIREKSPNRCPLCEQRIDAEVILRRIELRLEELKERSREASEFRAELAATLRLLDELLGRVRGMTTQGERAGANGEQARVAADHFAAVLEAEIQTLKRAEGASEAWSADAVARGLSAFETARAEVVTGADRAKEELAETPRDREILALVDRARNVERLLKDLSQTERAAEVWERRTRRAGEVYHTFLGCKMEEIERVYSEIEADVRKFYDILHPGEPYADFRIMLDHAKRASTDLRISMFGKGSEDPRAYASDGHLDSLSLCIFLASVKRFAGPCRLMILDDVITSIDAGHRGRVAELLLSHFEDWQLIITTHDADWLRELEDHQRAFKAGHRFLNKRIVRWNLSEGPVIRPYKPRWEHVEDRLNKADKQAANEARQCLEWILGRICDTAEVRVRYRENGRYLLADLLEPARERLIKLLPAKKDKVEQIFTEIVASGTPKDLLSHYNPNAQFAIGEIRRFCEAVKALDQWYRCRSCGSLLTYSREFGFLRCANKKCTSPTEWKTA